MDWRDDGILLSVRHHGENAAIIEVLTREHGRHAGVVRGGTSRKLTPILQPGAELDLTWRARLAEHLGSFTVEPLRTRAGAIMGDRLALAGLNAVCAILCLVLPEREPHGAIHGATQALLDMVGEEGWPVAYLHWELAVLGDLGYGMDFSSCAATGGTEDLVYVSPKSGRAVSRAGAAGYEDRLLPLPGVLRDPRSADFSSDIGGVVDGLRTTGHFLTHAIQAQAHRALPDPRQRLIDLLGRSRAIS